MTFAFVRRYHYPRSGGAWDLDFGGDGYAVEFDTFSPDLGDAKDPAGRHIAVVHNSSAKHLATWVAGSGLRGSTWHRVRVTFESGMVSVWFNDEKVLSAVSLPSFKEFDGYFGFTASGARRSERHLVRNFRVQPGDG